MPPPPPMPDGYPGGQDAWNQSYYSEVEYVGAWPDGYWSWNYYMFYGDFNGGQYDGQWAMTAPPPGETPGGDSFSNLSAQQYKAKRSRPSLNPPGYGGGGLPGGGMP